MSRVASMLSLVGLTMAVTVGCGESPTADTPTRTSTQQAGAAQAAPTASQPTSRPTESTAEAVAGPEEVVTTFLEAVRSGNEQTAAAMLTPLALKRTAEHELSVAPPGSPTAEFTVGDVAYVEGGGAHVASTWSDVVDNAGNRRTDTLVWMMRRETSGWRIAGLGTTVFPDQPPLFLNFEDPEDMLRKQQLTEEEITRRADEATSATNASSSTNSAAAGRQAQLPPSGAATPRR